MAGRIEPGHRGAPPAPGAATGWLLRVLRLKSARGWRRRALARGHLTPPLCEQRPAGLPWRSPAAGGASGPWLRGGFSLAGHGLAQRFLGAPRRRARLDRVWVVYQQPARSGGLLRNRIRPARNPALRTWLVRPSPPTLAVPWHQPRERRGCHCGQHTRLIDALITTRRAGLPLRPSLLPATAVPCRSCWWPAGGPPRRSTDSTGSPAANSCGSGPDDPCVRPPRGWPLAQARLLGLQFVLTARATTGFMLQAPAVDQLPAAG